MEDGDFMVSFDSRGVKAPYVCFSYLDIYGYPPGNIQRISPEKSNFESMMFRTSFSVGYVNFLET